MRRLGAELKFTVHPALRKVPEQTFCLAGPGGKTALQKKKSRAEQTSFLVETLAELQTALSDLDVSALLLQLLWTRDPDHPDALRTWLTKIGWPLRTKGS